MNTIQIALNRIFRSLGFRKNHFGISGDFRILERSPVLPKNVEHMDWAIRHGGFELPYKGAGERAGVLDTGFDIDHSDLKGQVEAACFIKGCPDEPDYFDNVGHGCINPEAMVMTSFCGLETIEEFYNNVPGDNTFFNEELNANTKDVRSLNIHTLSFNNVMVRSKIEFVHKIRFSGTAIKVNFEGGEVTLTPWHPVYVQTSARGRERTIKRIRADRLSAGQKIIKNDSLLSPATSYKKLDMGGDTYILDEEMAWLIGFLKSDGHLFDRKYKQYRITFSQAKQNREAALKACNIIESKFGKKVSSYVSRNQTVYYIDHKKAWELIQELGIESGNRKSLDHIRWVSLVSKSPVSVITSFLAGYIDGDGSIGKHGKIRICCFNEEFAKRLRLLIETIGYAASVYPVIDHRPKWPNMWHIKFRDTYLEISTYIAISRKRQRMLQANICRQYRNRVIKNVESIAYDGYMYDLTVESAHNYIANGVIVSNTFCAGEIVAKSDGEGIVGVAPEATLFGGKVIYGDGRDRGISVFENALIDGIIACIAEGCGVISMSLGSNHHNPKVEDALATAVESGIIPFAAAGNEGMDGSPYASLPASYKDCISIAAADQNDMAQWFSTEGVGGEKEEQPELAIASLEYYWGCIPGGYGKMIGTSMACPMAAGVALLWRQAMKERGLLKTGRDVIGQYRSWIQRVANDTNQNGWDPAIGWGVLLLDSEDEIV